MVSARIKAIYCNDAYVLHCLDLYRFAFSKNHKVTEICEIHDKGLNAQPFKSHSKSCRLASTAIKLDPKDLFMLILLSGWCDILGSVITQ